MPLLERFPPIAPETTRGCNVRLPTRSRMVRAEVRGPFIPLLYTPELARRVQRIGELLRFGGVLDRATAELATLVTARRWLCGYEWDAHSRIAREQGLLSAGALDAIAQGNDPADLNLAQRTALDF